MDGSTIRGAALILLVALLWYALVWGSIDGFVRSIDHCELLFCDFVRHYYPTGASFLRTGEPTQGYYYSAFFALLLSSICWLDLGLATIVWGIIQIASICALWIVATRWRFASTPKLSLAYLALLLASFPILHNFKWGQLSVPITAAMLAAVAGARGSAHPLPPFWLGVATAIKYYPALLVFPWLVQRRWKMLALFAGVILLTVVVLPSLFLGVSGWRRFEALSQAALQHDASHMTLDPNSQYLPHVILRNLYPLIPLHYLSVMIVLSTSVAALNLYFAYKVLTRDEAGTADDRLVLAVCLLMLSLPLLLHSSWPHYFVYLPFCQVALYQMVGERLVEAPRRIAIGLLAGSVVFGSLPFFNLISALSTLDTYGYRGFLLLSNLLLLPVVYELTWRMGSQSLQRSA